MSANPAALSERTLGLLAKAQNDLAKATFSTATGLVNYDLEAPAKQLFPVVTPIRNLITRVTSKNGDTATKWKAITAINTSAVFGGISEGNRGAEIAVNVANYLASYATLGHEVSTTFEADEAAEGFDNARARAGMSLLNSVFLTEENVILGGNASVALGTPATPVLAGSTTGGTLATQTLSVIVVGLTLAAFQRATVAGGFTQTVSRTNLDGSSDSINFGNSQKSANVTASITGPTGSCAATVTALSGAVAYAWFWGAAGSEKLGAITTVNAVSITATAAGTMNASTITADTSQDALVFDGLLTQAMKAGSNAYIKSLDNGALTSDGATGIVEIDAMLQDRYTNYLLSPNTIWLSAQEAININKKIIANGGAPLIRMNVDQSGQVSIQAGTAVGSYLNKFTGDVIALRIHPKMPFGTMLATTERLPYTVADVPTELYRLKQRRGYYQTEWPVVKRRYESGVYVTELLQHYAPFSMAVLQNIKNG